MLGERERSSYRRKRKLPPVFFSVNLPNYVRKIEADLFYYSESKNIDPPEENKQRIFQDWLEKSKQQKKKIKIKQTQNTQRINIQQRPNTPISTRDLIAKSANLWQHLSRTKNRAHEIYRGNPNNDPLPEYKIGFVDLPIYQVRYSRARS
jgi:hypothetical protein